MDNFSKHMNEWMTPISDSVYNFVFTSINIQGQNAPVVVFGLGISAVLFTLYLKGMNLYALKYAFYQLLGRYKTLSRPSQTSKRHAQVGSSVSGKKNNGEISHFQALSTALSGTVGVGNIGGVAIAIGIGGPGAVFWIFVAGFLGMSTKAIECTLATKFRSQGIKGEVLGGPMWYLKKGLALKGLPKLGKVLGAFYALTILFACFGIGNMFQSNQAFAQTQVLMEFINVDVTSSFATLFGIGLSLIVALVILGGIRSIARVASAVVPLMAGLYIFCALIVLALNYQYVPQALSLIITQAFNPQSVEGGLVGCILIGFQRALFSNEAGLGSSSIAHAAVKTQEPASEGLVSLLEPMIDSMIILMISSLVLLTVTSATGGFADDLEGIALTSAAFAATIPWFPIPLALAACLFAFSTILAWSYYGLQAFEYLVGSDVWKQRCFNGVFCFFIIIGAVCELDAIINLSDALVFMAAIPNLIGLYLLSPYARDELEAYIKRIRRFEASGSKKQSLGKSLG